MQKDSSSFHCGLVDDTDSCKKHYSFSLMRPREWRRMASSFFSIPSYRPSWIVYVALVAGLGITSVVSFYFNTYQETMRQHAFKQSILKLKMGIVERNLRYQHLLKSLSALFNARQALTYEEWQVFVSRIITPDLFPGVLEVGYIEKVEIPEIPQFKSDVKNQLGINIPLGAKLSSSKKSPSSSPATKPSLGNGRPLCLVKYPSKLTLPSAHMPSDPLSEVGFDVCSRPASNKAIRQATLEAKGILTPLVHLKGDIKKEWSTLIAYFPVYKDARVFDPHVAGDVRWQSLRGWVTTSIDIKKYLEGFIPETIYVVVIDGEHKIYQQPAVYHPSSHEQTFKLTVGGRVWALQVGTLPLSDQGFYNLLKVLIPLLGISVSLMLAVFIWSLTSTKRRALEIADYISQDLRASEFKNRTMIDNIPGAIFRCVSHINWQMEFISQGIEEITGYPAAMFISNEVCLADLIYPDDVELVESTVGLIPVANHSYFVEYRLLHKNGTVRWVYERGQTIQNQDTGHLFLTGALFDISERKENERDLQKLTLAMQNAGEGIIFLNGDLCLATLNQAFAHMLGFTSPPALVGQPIVDYVHPDFRQDFLALFHQTASSHKKTYTFKALKKDKTEFYAHISLLKANDNDELAQGYFCFVRDVTDRIQEEAKLAQAVEEARRANKTKSEFLATMSHELRTPLNAIIGYSEMLMEEITETQQEMFADLKKINYAGRHLLDLINDILDVSKLEAGKITLYPEKFNIYEMISYLADIISPNIAKNNNTLHIDCPSDIGEMYSDFMKVKQGLINLLSNAAKFTENGTIWLTVQEVKKRNQAFIRFSVKDTGCGITKEQIKKLFKPFIQADSSTTRKYGGTGLGLTITKQFVEMLEGLIQVDSKPGEGSTFSITLARTSRLTPGVVSTSPSLPQREEYLRPLSKAHASSP